MTPGLRLVAGACAGIIAMTSTYPLDMVRGRLTVQESAAKQQYRGMWHATATIVREEGFFALYKGWLPSVIGVVPYVGLNFAVYETLKDMIIRSEATAAETERDLSWMTRLACGAVAGTTGQTVAYPFDVARRRLQVSGWHGADHLVKVRMHRGVGSGVHARSNLHVTLMCECNALMRLLVVNSAGPRHCVTIVTRHLPHHHT